ncbi:MAG: hypothetical protein JSV19_03670, partial [Phycisphaerales bacterium]
MTDVVSRIAGVPDHTDLREKTIGCLRGFWPLAAPFLTLLCDPRREMASVAACWSILILPGVLAVNLLFPAAHPFGRGFSRLGVASAIGLLPFGLVAWIGCLAGQTLTTVLIIYGILYAVCLILLLWVLIRRGPTCAKTDAPWPSLQLSLGGPKWAAALMIPAMAVLMGGIAVATDEAQSPSLTPGFWGARHHWWQGTVLGAAASVLMVPLILAGTRRRPGLADDAEPVTKARTDAKKRARRPPTARSDAPSPGSGLVAFLWLAVAGLTWHLMMVAYALPADDLPSHMHRPPWNSDDVTYVSEAVDYRYGAVMGKYEPSIGSDLPLGRVGVSPLVAPLVATIARVTGVGCGALHHSVLPPLVILVGMSAMTAALMVVFRMHRWAVPLGLLVVALIIYKSWEYERSMVEFTIWRAMQTKSVHLWMIHPLQLAILLLLLFRPNKRHLFLGLGIAVVAHAAHPFATIVGAAWSAIACAASAIWHRNALPKILIVLMGYAALGGTFYAVSHAEKSAKQTAQISTGRVAGVPEQSRDLVRVDNKPIPRHDPRILFGWNMVFNLGALAAPLVLAFGRRHREFLLPGLFGVVTLICCNSAFLGGLINKAVPTPVLWRFRWVLPSLVHSSIVAFALYWALSVLLRRSDRTTTPIRSFFACAAVVGAFGLMLSNASAYAAKAGPKPGQLSKFSDDMHGVVDLLGGVEASPFV